MTDADWDARLNAPQPCREDGNRYDGGYTRPAWTPKAFLIRGDRLILTCRSCDRGPVEAPAQSFIDKGQGDLPWSAFTGQWKCACGSKDIEVSLDLAKDRTP
jgi:hypothetical protein